MIENIMAGLLVVYVLMALIFMGMAGYFIFKIAKKTLKEMD